MAKVEVSEDELRKLAGKVVLITGGANGIGKTAARLFYEYGANVAIGDLNEEAGNALINEFGSRGHFVKTDITSWASQRQFFQSALDKFGSIDCVCANAGMPEKANFLFEEQFEEDGQLAAPDFRVVDTNIKGTMNTCKLALHHFDKARTSKGALVIVGSAAGYFGTSPILTYASAKHALVGLMRSLAILSLEKNYRVNVVAPWLTATEFSSELSEIWGDRPINSQREVAEAILIACADESLNGRGLFVAKQIVDVEGPLHRLESQWLGSAVADLFEMGRVHLQKSFGKESTHYLD